MHEHTCGGWLVTNNDSFDNIVKLLSDAEAQIALGDDVLFDENSEYMLLYYLGRIRNIMNRVSKYAKK